MNTNINDIDSKTLDIIKDIFLIFESSKKNRESFQLNHQIDDQMELFRNMLKEEVTIAAEEQTRNQKGDLLDSSKTQQCGWVLRYR